MPRHLRKAPPILPSRLARSVAPAQKRAGVPPSTAQLHGSFCCSAQSLPTRFSSRSHLAPTRRRRLRDGRSRTNVTSTPCGPSRPPASAPLHAPRLRSQSRPDDALCGPVGRRQGERAATRSSSRTPKAPRSPTSSSCSRATCSAARSRARRGRATPSRLLLPNSVGLVITLFGLNAYGRVAAMLNFTAGKKNLSSALRTGRIRTVLTSRRFLDAGKLHDLVDALGAIEWAPGKKVRIVALEDVRGSLNIFDKVAGAVRAAIAGKFSRGSAKGTRRSRGRPVHLRHRGRAQGRRADQLQPGRQHLPDARSHAGHPRPRADPLEPAADVPFLRADGGHLRAAVRGREGRALSEPAALPPGRASWSSAARPRCCWRPTRSSPATSAPPSRASLQACARSSPAPSA